jgi:hypothetical protein
MEVPFTHPSTDGAHLGLHGAIDMIAAVPTLGSGMMVYFIVECKRASDKIKNWILLRNEQQEPRWPTFAYSQPTGDNPMAIGITRGVTFPALGYSHSADFDFIINAIEVNTQLSSVNREQAARVYNSLKQAMHGTYAFETAYPKVVEGIYYLRTDQSRTHIYLPVVITTANLYTPDMDVCRIADGEIPADAFNLGDPRKWVTFEFALPDYLSYETPRDGGGIAVPKRTVVIVNHKYVEDFLLAAREVATIDAIPPV